MEDCAIASASSYSAMYSARAASSAFVDLGHIRVGELHQQRPDVVDLLAQSFGDLELVPAGTRPTEIPVDEVVHPNDGRRRSVLYHLQAENVADAGDRARPVVEEILVADEGALRLAGGPFGEQRLIQPSRSAADVTLPPAVVPLLAVDDCRRMAKDRHEARGNVERLGATAPEGQEPGEARVLDDQVVGLFEPPTEPVAELVGDLVHEREVSHVRPGGRACIRNLHTGPPQETGVELDDPLRLREAARISLVGGYLRLGDVEAQPLQDSGEEARAAATRSGDEHERAPVLIAAFSAAACTVFCSSSESPIRNRSEGSGRSAHAERIAVGLPGVESVRVFAKGLTPHPHDGFERSSDRFHHGKGSAASSAAACRWASKTRAPSPLTNTGVHCAVSALSLAELSESEVERRLFRRIIVVSTSSVGSICSPDRGQGFTLPSHICSPASALT